MVTLEGSNFLQWGLSMYRDPTRREIGFIGKRDGPNPYHWAVYRETTNTWDISRPVWSTGNVSGHGYDHNACDPATGDVYHVPYGSNVVQKWNGSWSTLPAWSQNTSGLGGLTWFPGLGLFYNDGFGLLHWNGSSWVTRFTLNNGSYHDFSEYNDTADVLIFGGGNQSSYFKMTRALVVTPIAAPAFTIGANPNTQGIAVSDPSSATLIARADATGAWAAYDIGTNTWSALTQSTGSGATPQNGLPPLAVDTNNAPLSCPIEDLGVMMFVQHRGSGTTPAEVWLYRHR